MRAQAKARSFLILARRRGGLSKFKQDSFSCLNNTTPALRATPPQLRRGNRCIRHSCLPGLNFPTGIKSNTV
jgi:hypothetical protein